MSAGEFITIFAAFPQKAQLVVLQQRSTDDRVTELNVGRAAVPRDEISNSDCAQYALEPTF